MDNITHSLTGLALARLGLNRVSPRATLLLVLSANAPDADILALSRGSLPYFEAHRGYTHSLIALPVMAVLVTLVVAAIYRQRLPWRRAGLLCSIGLASHLLLDWTNSYGVRLLLPFSSAWFHCDVNALYDPYLMAVLAVAAVWPLFARLVSGEIGAQTSAGRGIAWFAVVFFVLFDCGRAALHARAVAQLESRLYEGQPPLHAAALPEAFTPTRWRGIVETRDAYRLIPLHPLSDQMPEGGRVFFKPPVTPALRSAAATELFRFFSYFSRFPVWSQQPVTLDHGPGTRIDLVDLRFGVPGGGSLHCIALEDAGNRILDSWFTYGPGTRLGWGSPAPAPADQPR